METGCVLKTLQRSKDLRATGYIRDVSSFQVATQGEWLARAEFNASMPCRVITIRNIPEPPYTQVNGKPQNPLDD